MRTKQCGYLHRAGETTDIKSIRLNLGESPGIELVDKTIHRSGRDLATIHPAGQTQ
jgi:hypothetical protein